MDYVEDALAAIHPRGSWRHARQNRCFTPEVNEWEVTPATGRYCEPSRELGNSWTRSSSTTHSRSRSNGGLAGAAVRATNAQVGGAP